MRQALAEPHETHELAGVPRRAPFRVVTVLLAAARVPSGRLQMTARVRADPDVLVRGRNREVLDALDDRRIANARAIGVEIEKSPASRAAPAESRRLVA